MTEITMGSAYRSQVAEEIGRIPPEYLPSVLRMVRAFRESVTLKTAEATIRHGWKEAVGGETYPASDLWNDLDVDE